jgi:alpha-beta hydrolase superfamily lysophospholipase
MREDERDGIQATKLSARLGAEFMKAQEWVPEHIAAWNQPLLAIIPGDDKLINSELSRELLSKIKKEELTLVFYPENYHESFNELNRKEVFARVLEWCEPRI